MKYAIFAAASVGLLALPATADDHDASYAVKAAALALPAAFEGTARVVSVAGDGSETVAQEGSAPMTCEVSKRSEDDGANRLDVWCMPHSMRPLLARIDELRNAGIPREEGMKLLKAEYESGELGLPAQPGVGYAFRGAEGSYGKPPAEIEGSGWQLVFVPFATGDTLGLIETSEGSMPWLMGSGTPFAHIMVFGSSDETFD